ncbi:unnamed protein product [Schistocephalus solidus]|uniref:Endo/exonuclease/phosphatase domain-containing protein n=1 Tax=Schistocephalus solidus TaxID=70667 RepID=A0A183T2Y4_SCHSO|nr:unnamed protein product [Schistocephalus solidus]
MWLLEVGFFPAATPQATVTTGGLNKVMVSRAVCASSPSMSDSRNSHLPPLKKSYGGGDSNPAAWVSPLTLAAWNVRSRLDNPRSNQPERRMALVARELSRYKVDIASLSETRLSEQGQLQEVSAGYTFSWSGWLKTERRDAGVAFAIRNDIVGRLPCLPQGINNRLMSLCLLIRGDLFTTIISAYTPPITSSDAAKDKFYWDLHALLANVPKVDDLIFLGDFNARSPADQRLLLPSDVGEGHVDAPSIAALAAAGLCFRPKARSTGRAGNQGDPRCRCLKGSPPRHLSDEAPTATPTTDPRSVLNCSSAIPDGAIDRLPQVDTNNDLDLPPSLPETIRAVQQISRGKAPGSDAIPPEVYKHGGLRLMAELTAIF